MDNSEEIGWPSNQQSGGKNKKTAFGTMIKRPM